MSLMAGDGRGGVGVVGGGVEVEAEDQALL